MAGEKSPYVSFLVQMPPSSQQVNVFGETLGDLRDAVRQELKIPHFQQKIVYLVNGDPVELKGDSSTPMKEKPGLLDVKELMLSRQVDPRLKTEKETAFLEALSCCRFADAKEILEDTSGVTIDPNCVFTANINALPRDESKGMRDISVTECPTSYKHPGITVAMLAGLEYVVGANARLPDPIQKWLALEPEVCEVVALLIQQGADVNATGNEILDAQSAGDPKVDGKTPLCAAVQRGSPTLVKMLLDAKADPNHKVDLGGSAWGPGPGAQLPEAFLKKISNGSMGERNAEDPRNKYAATILDLLAVSRASA